MFVLKLLVKAALRKTSTALTVVKKGFVRLSSAMLFYAHDMKCQ